MSTIHDRLRALALGAATMLYALVATAASERAPIAALVEPSVIAPTAKTSAMLGIARAGDRLVAGGERGVILLSDDNGQSWRQVATPVRASITAIHFVDAKRGWAVGHLGVILRTTDGGTTWIRQLDGQQLVPVFKQVADATAGAGKAAAVKYAQMLADDGPDKPWLAVHFTDARNGIVVGAYNLAVTTQDGGASWQPLSFRLPNPKSLHLYGVAVSGRTVLISGEQGLLLRSDDGGATFAALEPPYRGTWFGVLALSADDWVVYGLRGNVFRSADGGRTWQALTTGLGVSIASAVQRKSGQLAVVSQLGDVLVAEPGASAFQRSNGAVGAAVAGAVEAADGAIVSASLRGPLRSTGAARP